MKLDLHCHSWASFDCGMHPEKILERAVAAGLDGVAITDHEAIGGALEAQRIAARRGDVVVLVGEEIDTRAGEIVGLFLKEEIHCEDPLEAIRAIHDQDGVALLPHPFTKNLAIDERVARQLDACEGFNSRHARMASVDGKRGEPDIVSFADQYNLTLTAGSDAHFYREIGRARTIIPAANADELRPALLAGNTVLSGRRSSSLNRFATVVLRTLGRMARPEPES